MNCITIWTLIKYTYIATPILLVVTSATISTLSWIGFENWESWNDTLISTSLRHRVAQWTFEDVRSGRFIHTCLKLEVGRGFGRHELQYLVAHGSNLLLAHVALLRQRNFVKLRYVSNFKTIIIYLIRVLFFNSVDNVQEFLLEYKAPISFLQLFCKLTSFIKCCIHVYVVNLPQNWNSQLECNLIQLLLHCLCPVTHQQCQCLYLLEFNNCLFTPSWILNITCQLSQHVFQWFVCLLVSWIDNLKWLIPVELELLGDRGYILVNQVLESCLIVFGLCKFVH